MVSRRSIVLFLGAAITLSVVAWITLHAPSDARESAAAPQEPGAEGSAVEDDHGRLRDAEGLGVREDAVDAAPTIQRELADAAAWSAPVRGRIIDARTDAGVSRARVSIRGEKTEKVRTDDQGQFGSTRAFAQGPLRLAAEDQISGTGLAQVVHMHSQADCGAGCAALLRAEMGPTFEIQIVGAGPEKSWRGHVVERRGGLDVRTWSEVDCPPDETSGKHWLRYTTLEHEPDPTLVPWLVVASDEDRLRGETGVPATLGLHALVVTVAPWAASLTGKITDTEGRPVEALVLALPRGQRTEVTWPEAETDETGRYAFAGLEPGSLRVLVASNHREAVHADVELLAGEERQLDFTLPSVRIAGNIEGVLVGPVEAERPEGLLLLTSADGGPTQMLEFAGLPPRLFGEIDAEPPGRTRFFFDDVPEGRYRIIVVPFDGRHYEPAELVVTAPSNSAVFTTSDDDGIGEEQVQIRVRDRVTGAPLASVARLGHFWWYWSAEIETVSGAEEGDWGDPRWEIQWLISAPGYVPAFVSIAAAEEVDGELVIDVALEPGFGAGLVVVDARRTLGGALLSGGDVLPMPSLAGARIVAGGRVIGTSDANGLALCRSAGPIEGFEVELDGWSVLTVQRFLGHAQTPDGTGFVWMTRD